MNILIVILQSNQNELLEIKPLVIYSHSICLIGLMVFNVTFNNISVIAWRSVLLLEETGIPGENH